MSNKMKNKKTKSVSNNDYFYSASINGFFYRPQESQAEGIYPDDLQPISNELYQQLFDGQKNGKLIVAGGNGLPTLKKIPPPTPEELQRQAETEKQRLLKKAAEKIGICQDAVDLDIATDEEKYTLTNWRVYRVLLNRTDCSTAPDINWPVEPQ
ncbi:putative CPS-53 (KpLE1) prophage; tail fiber assembly [Xenorhabdus nematophila str. Anatoliense]|nr:putative CPS-53 (KpLE1) prophage; tail fiber assembly [Xenorhabdus nematophila str. Anatoliense]